MPKGRHRRHRQARALKQQPVTTSTRPAPCEECGRTGLHASWCLAEADLGEADPGDGSAGADTPVG